MQQVMENLERIRYLILDVDGTMTDGGVYLDSRGEEMKRFSIKDGAGILLARQAGIESVILTGRESRCVQRRAGELSISLVFQGVKDKRAFLLDFLGYLAERTGSGSGLRVNGELPYGVTVNERRPVESSASGEVASAETEKGSLWFVQNFNSGSATMDFAERYRDIETGEIIGGKKELTGYQCLILGQA